MIYMLYYLGVNVIYASLTCGIKNSNMYDSLLMKKHEAIVYHKTRESAAAGIVHPIKILGPTNFVPGKLFWKLYICLTQ